MRVKPLILSVYFGIGKAAEVVTWTIALIILVIELWYTMLYGVYLKLSGNESDISWGLALYVPLHAIFWILVFIGAVLLLALACMGIENTHNKFVKWLRL